MQKRLLFSIEAAGKDSRRVLKEVYKHRKQHYVAAASVRAFQLEKLPIVTGNEVLEKRNGAAC